MSARAFFTLQSDAQAYADKVHAWLIANDAGYAKSVAAGQTKQWDVPNRALDANDKPMGDWYVTIEPRCENALTAAEKLALQPVAKTGDGMVVGKVAL